VKAEMKHWGPKKWYIPYIIVYMYPCAYIYVYACSYTYMYMHVCIPLTEEIRLHIFESPDQKVFLSFILSDGDSRYLP